MKVYYNPEWMNDETRAILFLVEIPDMFKPTSKEQIIPYLREKIRGLIIDAKNQNEHPEYQIGDVLEIPERIPANPTTDEMTEVIQHSDPYLSWIRKFLSENPKPEESMTQRETETIWEEISLYQYLQSLKCYD